MKKTVNTFLCALALCMAMTGFSAYAAKLPDRAQDHEVMQAEEYEVNPAIEAHVVPAREVHVRPAPEYEVQPSQSGSMRDAQQRIAGFEPVNANGPRHSVKVPAFSCHNVECKVVQWFLNAPDAHYFYISIPTGVTTVFNIGNAQQRKVLTVLDAKGAVAFREDFGGDCHPDSCYGMSELAVESFLDGKYTFQVVQLDNNQVLASGDFTIQPARSAPAATKQAHSGKDELTAAQ